MSVPFLDLARQHAGIRTDVEKAVSQVFATQHFILGENGKALEKEVAADIGVTQAIGVASGTDALLLGLRALGLQRGEGVLTTSFTFFATAGAIHNAGGRPFFADIREDTFNLNPADVRHFLEEACRPGEEGRPVHKETGVTIRVLLPVHLYGLCCEMDALGALAREHHLEILEDACQAYGASCKGRKAGALGRLAAFSFFPTKNLGGAGDGGILTTDDADLAERLRLIRVHGSRERYIHEEIGYNSRLDNLQAAVLRVKLPHVESWNEARRVVARRYSEGLADVPEVIAPRVPEGWTPIYHQYVIRAEQRDDLKAYLGERQIGSMVYYPVPLHLQPCFRFLGYREGDLPVTEKAAREVLALPVFAELTQDETAEVCRAVQSFYSGRH